MKKCILSAFALAASIAVAAVTGIVREAEPVTYSQCKSDNENAWSDANLQERRGAISENESRHKKLVANAMMTDCVERSRDTGFAITIGFPTLTNS